jgi:hypothetical protein
VLLFVAGHVPSWVGVVAVIAALCCALYGASTYTRGNDGLSKYQQ